MAPSSNDEYDVKARYNFSAGTIVVSSNLVTEASAPIRETLNAMRGLDRDVYLSEIDATEERIKTQTEKVAHEIMRAAQAALQAQIAAISSEELSAMKDRIMRRD